MLALLSAAAFGVTVPVLGWAGVGVGPLTTAALLYFGAALSAFLQAPLSKEAGAPLTRRELPALLLMALAGAAAAPTALAWGLQRTGPVTGGLLLNLEAVWSVVLAGVVFREHLGRLRVERQPPREQLPGRVDRQAEQHEPRCAEGRLIGQHGGCHFHCARGELLLRGI